MDEIRYAIRRLTARRGPTLVSILTLACAIGAAAASASLLNAVVLRPLPVADPDRLVVVGSVWTLGARSGVSDSSHDYTFYRGMRERDVFDRMAGGGRGPRVVPVRINGETVQTPAYFASYDFFDVLGVSLQIGRSFTRDEDSRGAPLVVILSHEYWRRTFGADPGVLGRSVAMGGQPAEIIGVTRRGFRGLSLAGAPAVFLPLHSVGQFASSSNNYFDEPGHASSPQGWLTIVGRLSPGSSPAQALARLQATARPSARSQYVLTDVNTAAVPAAARGGVRQFSSLLALTVGLLLLIGCSTVGMLLLVRTEARQPEFATCLALGASRVRLARGVALEGALLATAGAALAIPVALWLFAAVRGFQLPGGIALETIELSIDPLLLSTAAGCAFGATVLVALIAGVFGFRADVAEGLRARTGATPRVTRRRTRSILVVAQVAVALVLLAGAGLFGRSLMAALRLNPAIDTGRILEGTLFQVDGRQAQRSPEFFDQLCAQLQGNPAIRSMASYVAPGGMTPGGTIPIDRMPREMPSYVAFMGVDDRYFVTMGMSLLEGRHFTAADSEHAPLVGIVSASFARLIAQDGSAIGRSITMPFNRTGEAPPSIEVIGVVPDLITSVARLEPLVLYAPIWQHSVDPGRDTSRRTIVLRAADDVEAARREFAAAVALLDSTLRPPLMLAIDQRLARQMMPQRFGGVVLGALGFVAILLTVLGTYVMADSMAVLRMREMGIRAALGATGGQLGSIVMRETLRLVGVGLAAGLLLAWWGAETVRSLLFQVEPLDAVTLLAVATTILALAVAVSVRPALRAARVDLGSVLRAE